MSLRKQRRIQLLIVGAVLLSAATALAIVAIGQAGQFFMSPSEVLAEQPGSDRRIRLGGLVAPGSVAREDIVTRFAITDCAATVEVVYRDIPPDLFAEGEDAIATGRLVNGVLEADELLAKHDETYRPPEVVEALAETGCAGAD